MSLEAKTSEGRHVDLYEYQTCELFEAHGVPVSVGIVVSVPQEAESAARELGGDLVIIRAQVKTGGWGEAGGVKLARSSQEAADRAKKILGMDIKSHKIRRVLVVSNTDIAREFYFSVLLDRPECKYLAMCSVDGNINIETLAKERPEALAKVTVSPNVGVDEAKAHEIASATGFDAEMGEKTVPVLLKLWGVYSGEDATLVEVNPLVLMEQGEIVALDGRVTLDDNARFHHSGHEALINKAAEDPLEAKAKTFGLNYVKLDGQVGVTDNDAGLIMSTLDVIVYTGEEYGMGPTSFLDVGGGADANIISGGLAVILGDPDMHSVFVNVFGGITACDEIAKGIVATLDALGETASKPIIVRLDGNTVTEGRTILAQASHPLVTPIDTMDGTAAKATRLAARSDVK